MSQLLAKPQLGMMADVCSFVIDGVFSPECCQDKAAGSTTQMKSSTLRVPFNQPPLCALDWALERRHQSSSDVGNVTLYLHCHVTEVSLGASILCTSPLPCLLGGLCWIRHFLQEWPSQQFPSL